MNAPTSQTKLPSGAYAAFDAALDALGMMRPSLPPKITSGSLKGPFKSKTVRTEIVRELKFFGLLDPDGTVRDELRELVSLARDEREKRMRGLLEDKYPFLFTTGLDLRNTADATFRAKFEERKLPKIMLTRSITFFINAADANKLPISDKITRPSRRPSTSDLAQRNTVQLLEQNMANKQSSSVRAPEAANNKTSVLAAVRETASVFSKVTQGWSDSEKQALFETLRELFVASKKS